MKKFKFQIFLVLVFGFIAVFFMIPILVNAEQFPVCKKLGDSQENNIPCLCWEPEISPDPYGKSCLVKDITETTGGFSLTGYCDCATDSSYLWKPPNQPIRNWYDTVGPFPIRPGYCHDVVVKLCKNWMPLPDPPNQEEEDQEVVITHESSCSPEGIGPGTYSCECQGSSPETCEVGRLMTNPVCACCGDCTLDDALNVGVNIANIIIKYVGIIALAMFVLGGLMWIFSGGSADKVQKGKQIIIGAVVGLLIVLFAGVIINEAEKALLGTPVSTGGGSDRVELGELCDEETSGHEKWICIETEINGENLYEAYLKEYEPGTCVKNKCLGSTPLCCVPGTPAPPSE